MNRKRLSGIWPKDKKVVEEEFHSKIQNMIDETYESENDAFYKLLTGQLAIILLYREGKLIGDFGEIDVGDYESLRAYKGML